MGTITKDALFHRFGLNSSATDRAGSPSTWVYLDPNQGGVTLAGNVESAPLQGEHKYPGSRFVLLQSRNRNKGQIQTPLFPEQAGTLLNLATNLSSDGIPGYATLETYWNATIGTSFGGETADTGQKVTGVLCDGFSVEFNRKGALGVLQLNLDCFLNAEYELESAAPSPTFPSQEPYSVGRLFCDVDFADDSDAFGGWGGDASDLVSFGVNFQNGIEVYNHRLSGTAGLNGTWTAAGLGEPSATINGRLVVTSSKYLDLIRHAELRKVRARLAGYGRSPSGSTTCTTSLTAGTSVTVAVAATTGFAVNDYVILYQTTANKFAVAKVTTVTPGVSIVVDTLDVSMNGGSETITVKNTAWEIKVPTAYIGSRSPLVVDGVVRAIDFQATATLVSGQTSVLTVKAYDDDAT